MAKYSPTSRPYTWLPEHLLYPDFPSVRVLLPTKTTKQTAEDTWSEKAARITTRLGKAFSFEKPVAGPFACPFADCEMTCGTAISLWRHVVGRHGVERVVNSGSRDAETATRTQEHEGVDDGHPNSSPPDRTQADACTKKKKVKPKRSPK